MFWMLTQQTAFVLSLTQLESILLLEVQMLLPVCGMLKNLFASERLQGNVEINSSKMAHQV